MFVLCWNALCQKVKSKGQSYLGCRERGVCRVFRSMRVGDSPSGIRRKNILGRGISEFLWPIQIRGGQGGNLKIEVKNEKRQGEEWKKTDLGLWVSVRTSITSKLRNNDDRRTDNRKWEIKKSHMDKYNTCVDFICYVDAVQAVKLCSLMAASIWGLAPTSHTSSHVGLVFSNWNAIPLWPTILCHFHLSHQNIINI